MSTFPWLYSPEEEATVNALLATQLPPHNYETAAEYDAHMTGYTRGRQIGDTFMYTLYADEYHQARHDALTSLPNRRFLQEITPVIEQLVCEGGELLILAIDLDDFKAVNDAFGHSGADTVLRRGAQILGEHSLCIRMGGDEFVGITSADMVIENLRDIFLTHFKDVQDELGRTRFGISLGIALPKPNESLSGVMDTADARAHLDKLARLPELSEVDQEKLSIILWYAAISLKIDPRTLALYWEKYKSHLSL